MEVEKGVSHDKSVTCSPHAACGGEKKEEGST
jgi:hypothetical protein